MTLSRWPSARRPEAAILIAFLRSLTASVLQSAAPSATAAAAVAERPAQHAHLLAVQAGHQVVIALRFGNAQHLRSEEHTSELQSLMRISYAVFCLKKKKK